MRTGLRGEVPGVPGFFLMEVIVLVIVFISFSMVLVGWYSNFSSMKVDIMKRGQAIFIASNALESIRMHSKIPDQIDSAPGFKVTVSAGTGLSSGDFDLNNFMEVTVCVAFSDRLDPVCLTTGMVLRELPEPTLPSLSTEPVIVSDSESADLFLPNVTVPDTSVVADE